MALNDFRIDWERCIITCDRAGEALQPWGGETSYRYMVRVSDEAGDWSEYAYGSQYDYKRGDNDHCEEMAWMVLGDLLGAYNDPDEFFQLAIGEPDNITVDRARGILALLDFAGRIGPKLDAHAEEIWSARDGEGATA